MARSGGEGVAIPNDLLVYHLCRALSMAPPQVQDMHQEALVMWDYSEGAAMGEAARQEWLLQEQKTKAGGW